jgi:hypothetical protein
MQVLLRLPAEKEANTGGTTMNLYLVKQGNFVYDNYIGFVVAAETSLGARMLCAKHDSFIGEPNKFWLDHDDVVCSHIGTAVATEPGIVLDSYNRG